MAVRASTIEDEVVGSTACLAVVALNSRGNDRGRPGKDAPNDVVTTTIDAASLQATTEFFGQLAAASGPDDPLFRAASLLAEAWQPALNRSYRLGYDNGYCAGFFEAEAEMATRWRRSVAGVKAALKLPTRDELATRRGERR